MTGPTVTTGRFMGPRRGLVALSLAVAFMLIVFTALLSFTLGLAAQSLRVENAWAATQALYAAEAGLDIALQTGSGQPITGECGRARFAALAVGRQIIALGQVERAAGAPIRRAVAVQRASGGGIVRGSWRLVPPAQQTELITLIAQFKERGR